MPEVNVALQSFVDKVLPEFHAFTTRFSPQRPQLVSPSAFSLLSTPTNHRKLASSKQLFKSTSSSTSPSQGLNGNTKSQRIKSKRQGDSNSANPEDDFAFIRGITKLPFTPPRSIASTFRKRSRSEKNSAITAMNSIETHSHARITRTKASSKRKTHANGHPEVNKFVENNNRGKDDEKDEHSEEQNEEEDSPVQSQSR